MATYNAFKVLSSDDELVSMIWWTGKKIECSNKSVLRDLKDSSPNGREFSDGELFFKEIPNLYRSGYTYVVKTQVNEEG